MIQDHFVLKTNETSERHTESVKSEAESDDISPQITGRPSVAELLESPGGTNVLMSRKNTLFSSIPDSKDPLNQEQIRVEKPSGAVRSSESTSSTAS